LQQAVEAFFQSAAGGGQSVGCVMSAGFDHVSPSTSEFKRRGLIRTIGAAQGS